MNNVVRFFKENHYNNVKYNVPLSKYTSFKVGGNAAFVVTPESKKKIVLLIAYLNEYNIKYRVIGNGSNILPSDYDYEGVVIRTNRALNYIKVNNNFVTVGSGYSLMKLAYKMIEYQLTGLEFIGGIPGSIGGAIYMNAGAYNKEMKNVVQSVTLLDEYGELRVLSNEDLRYGYRKSILQKRRPQLIIETSLKLKHGKKEDIVNLLNKRKIRRQETQPLEFPSGGSIFRNPKNTHAFKLIDNAGLRGYQVGGAKVSEKHCNFIINYQHSTSQNIKDLINIVINKVYKESNIRLKPEIEFFNWENH